MTLKGDRIAEEFQALVEQYVIRRYGLDGQIDAAAAAMAATEAARDASASGAELKAG